VRLLAYPATVDKTVWILQLMMPGLGVTVGFRLFRDEAGIFMEHSFSSIAA
jgi:hypothetical protein